MPDIVKESPEEPDERLRLFVHTPAQALMRDQLVNSKSTSKQPCRDGEGSYALLSGFVR